MYKNITLLIVLIATCLLTTGCVSSPFDLFFNKNGDAKAQQTQQTQVDEKIGAKVYISSNPFISVPDLSDESNQICDDGICYINPSTEKDTKNNVDGINNKYEVLKNGDKERIIPLDNGRTIRIPPNAYYIVLYTWEKKTFQSTITDIVNELSKSKAEYGKYLIYGGIAIIVIFGLLGWFTKAYGFIGLGLVLGAATAGIAYYPWVSLVIIGIALLATIGYAVAELRNKSNDTSKVKQLNTKIETLEKENKVLRGLMDPRDMSLLETQLKQ